MTSQPEPQRESAAASGVERASESPADLSPTERSLPDELTNQAAPPTADLTTNQIGQILIQVFSHLLPNANEETIIDAELAHKALDLDRHELDILNEDSKRDHQRRTQEIKVVAFLAVAVLIAILVMCGLIAWRAPDKILEIVIPTITALGGLLGGYGIGRTRR